MTQIMNIEKRFLIDIINEIDFSFEIKVQSLDPIFFIHHRYLLKLNTLSNILLLFIVS